MLWIIDLHEDIENGIPSSLQVALAILMLAKDAFLLTLEATVAYSNVPLVHTVPCVCMSCS